MKKLIHRSAKLTFVPLFIVSILLSNCKPTQVVSEIDGANAEIINIHLPSLTYLYKLQFMIYESKELTRTWTIVYKSDDSIDKIKLRKIHSIDFPELRSKLDELKKNWTLKEQLTYDKIMKRIETLFDKEKSIMNQLNSYESYEDVVIIFQVDTEFERGANSITTETENIVKELSLLIEQRERVLKTMLGEN